MSTRKLTEEEISVLDEWLKEHRETARWKEVLGGTQTELVEFVEALMK